jgi:hypothetical protein
MKSRSCAVILAAAFALIAMAGSARADVAPPNSQGCNKMGTQAGDLCEQDNHGVFTGVQGRCTPAQCRGSAAYVWDGGPFDCPDGSICAPDASTNPPQLFVSSPYDCLLCLVPEGGLGTSTDSSGSSGCSINGEAHRVFGPWMLAGAASIVLLLKRRRRVSP